MLEHSGAFRNCTAHQAVYGTAVSWRTLWAGPAKSQTCYRFADRQLDPRRARRSIRLRVLAVQLSSYWPPGLYLGSLLNVKASSAGDACLDVQIAVPTVSMLQLH